MRLTKNQLQFIINSDVEAVVSFMQEDYRLEMIAAFNTIYNSKTYEKLVNTKTGLYLQSPDYIYDRLKDELQDAVHTPNSQA